MAYLVSLGENRGAFSTTKIMSPNIKEKWTDITVKYNNVTTAQDKVLVKYRTEGITLPRPENGSETLWTSTTTFTTTLDWSRVKTDFDAGKKYEVEVLAGKGAGILAHITDITESSGTYTVTIDETIPSISVGDKAVVAVDNWLKLEEITVDSAPDSNTVTARLPNVNSKWIQFKIELRGEEVQIEELLINNKAHQMVV